MKFTTFVVGACLLALLAYTSGLDKKTCRTEFSRQNRKQFDWINQCVKQLNYKTAREKVEKHTCVWKCILGNLKMLNPSGFLDQEQYNKHLLDEWIPETIEQANKTFQPCLKIQGDETDLSDELCKGYDPLVKCLNNRFANLCKGV